MTEQEWLEGTDATAMLRFWQHDFSERKLRLFFVSAVRASWDRIDLPDLFACVEMAEKYADGSIAAELLEQAESQALQAATNAANAQQVDTLNRVFAIYPCLGASGKIHYRLHTTGWQCLVKVADKHLSSCLREVVGNPSRPITLNPVWLAWNDSTVRRIAQSIYDERAFDRMTILADALEDAGCDNADILDHCRSEGPHVRGCWVVDALLGKVGRNDLCPCGSGKRFKKCCRNTGCI